MNDQLATIRVTGLGPHQSVSFHAELVDGDGQQWISEADFVASEDGIVDLSSQAPVKGSYGGVSAMGLIWSMMPSKSGVSVYRAPHDLGEQTTRFSVMSGDKELAHGNLTQLAIAGEVRRIDLKGLLNGVMLIPTSQGRHPGVLVVGGSEGGVPLQKAAWLASHGYVTLAVAYFRYNSLPSELASIPLEYFGRALSFLSERPEVEPGQLAVVGTSRGGELALQLGSMYPKIGSVVAYVPADVRFPGCCGFTVPPAWTWEGQPLAFVTSFANESRETAQQAKIQVERIHGAILLISGESDEIWPSHSMADSVMNRLHQEHFTYRFEHLSYAHAGHRAGLPEIVPAWTGSIQHPFQRRPARYGGTAEGNAFSTVDADPKVLDFLRQSFAKSAPK